MKIKLFEQFLACGVFQNFKNRTQNRTEYRTLRFCPNTTRSKERKATTVEK